MIPIRKPATPPTILRKRGQKATQEHCAAYDRGERRKQRVELAMWWGKQLADAERGAEVLPLRRSA